MLHRADSGLYSSIHVDWCKAVVILNLVFSRVQLYSRRTKFSTISKFIRVATPSIVARSKFRTRELYMYGSDQFRTLHKNQSDQFRSVSRIEFCMD